jgi:hypothetical protein
MLNLKTVRVMFGSMVNADRLLSLWVQGGCWPRYAFWPKCEPAGLRLMGNQQLGSKNWVGPKR